MLESPCYLLTIIGRPAQSDCLRCRDCGSWSTGFEHSPITSGADLSTSRSAMEKQLGPAGRITPGQRPRRGSKIVQLPPRKGLHPGPISASPKPATWLSFKHLGVLARRGLRPTRRRQCAARDWSRLCGSGRDGARWRESSARLRARTNRASRAANKYQVDRATPSENGSWRDCQFVLACRCNADYQPGPRRRLPALRWSEHPKLGGVV
jgi:hypothetical protein